MIDDPFAFISHERKRVVIQFLSKPIVLWWSKPVVFLLHCHHFSNRNLGFGVSKTAVYNTKMFWMLYVMHNFIPWQTLECLILVLILVQAQCWVTSYMTTRYLWLRVITRVLFQITLFYIVHALAIEVIRKLTSIVIVYDHNMWDKPFAGLICMSKLSPLFFLLHVHY